MESKDVDVPAAILACIIGLLLLEIFRRLLRKKKNPLVLIVGGTGAGKTTLFHQLRDGSSHQGTVPSMAKNSDTVRLARKDVRFFNSCCGRNASVIGSKRQAILGAGGLHLSGIMGQLCPIPMQGKSVEVDLVDIPGHPRVRGEATTYYGRADKVLFLVDAVEFMAQKSTLSEHLFEVISDASLHKHRVPVLIVCNKSDQVAKAHSLDFIRKRLEKEVEAVRSTRTTLGEGATQGVSIAKASELFSFGGLKRIPVTFASAAALTGEIGEIKLFLL